MTTVRSAVILAAGMGTRLKGYTQDQPKGFLQLEGQSLIERSIDHLIRHGMNEILIGTGYFHEHFDALKQKYPQIQTERNVDYAISGSMYTLYGMRHLVKEPFLLLESDLLYDPSALSYLLSDPLEDIILASGRTYSGDEVFIQRSPEGFLQNMSKDRSQLTHVSGELVGISKLSLAALHAMVNFAEPFYRKGSLLMHYEDAMVGTSTHHNLPVKIVEDLVWCEIDDEQHLQRALKEIYPRILERHNHAR